MSKFLMSVLQIDSQADKKANPLYPFSAASFAAAIPG